MDDLKKRILSLLSLRVTFFTGLLLLLVIGALFAGILALNGGALPHSARKESAFHRMLREYDFRYRRVAEADSFAVQRQELERLDNELDRLEKRTEGVEAWLSVLKRRRHLARHDSRYEQAYRQSVQRAALAFPYSEPIAALAAANLIRGAAITGDAEEQLRRTLPLLESSRLVPLRLSLHILLGDLKSPQRALAERTLENLLGENTLGAGNVFSAFAVSEAELIAADLAIMKIVAGDIPAASLDIQAALAVFPSPALIRLAAEYYYDFGDLVRSAELFSMLWDEGALSRQADALWLAGYDDNARTIWTMLASPDNPASWIALQNRALYNLAITARTRQEAVALLERLVGQASLPGQADAGDASRCYGLIRLSRLFNAPRALALLDGEKNLIEASRSEANLAEANLASASLAEASSAEVNVPLDILIDLEILKRRTEVREPARVVAETWLLLDRHPAVEALYEWGAWYFALYRNYTESALLLRTAVRQRFNGQWVQLYTARQQIHDGDGDGAEATLRAIPPQEAHWTAAANLGRLLEARRAWAQALEQYELAADALNAVSATEPDDVLVSRLQVNIARCLKNLGRIEESRLALEYALELNPDNIAARLELSRLQSP